MRQVTASCNLPCPGREGVWRAVRRVLGRRESSLEKRVAEAWVFGVPGGYLATITLDAKDRSR